MQSKNSSVNMKTIILCFLGSLVLSACDFNSQRIYQCTGNSNTFFASDQVNPAFRSCIFINGSTGNQVCQSDENIKEVEKVDFTMIFNLDNSLKFSTEESINEFNGINFELVSNDDIERRYKSEGNKSDRVETFKKTYIDHEKIELIFNKITNKIRLSKFSTDYEKFDNDLGLKTEQYRIVNLKKIEGECVKK